MKLAEQVKALRANITETDTTTKNTEEVKSLERLKYRLSDAIREGSTVSGQAHGWTDSDDNMCTLSAAVVAAKARGYID